MPICKFYNTREGCLKGNRCNFDHISDTRYPEDKSYNRYHSYNGRNNNGNISPRYSSSRGAPGLRNPVSKNVEKKKIPELIKNPPIWKLSCMAIESGKPNAIDGGNVTQEEAKWEAMKAFKAGTLNEYKITFERMEKTFIKKIKNIQEIFQKNSQASERLLISDNAKEIFFILENWKNYDGQMTGSNNTANIGIFGQAPASDSSSMFNNNVFNNKSIFGIPSNINNGKESENSALKKNPLVNNPFGSDYKNQNEAKGQNNSVYYTEPTGDNTISNVPSSASGGGSVWGSICNNNKTEIFTSIKTSNTINKVYNATGAANLHDADSITTDTENFQRILTLEDISQYEAMEFTYGKIPLLAPPKQYCH